MSNNIIAFGSKEPAIENLNLCRYTVNALKKSGIYTVRQLSALSIIDLLDLPNIGPVTCEEIFLSLGYALPVRAAEQELPIVRGRSFSGSTSDRGTVA